MQDKAETVKYDIISIDAFTGDGIPAHLMTREAIEIYLHRLVGDGLILFHISNRYYDLHPVLEAASRELKLYGCFNRPLGRTHLKSYQVSPRCIVMARDEKNLQPLLNRGWLMFNNDNRLDKMAPWTDDYINILAPLIEHIRAKS
jgi:spermidine synthase